MTSFVSDDKSKVSTGLEVFFEHDQDLYIPGYGKKTVAARDENECAQSSPAPAPIELRLSSETTSLPAPKIDSRHDGTCQRNMPLDDEGSGSCSCTVIVPGMHTYLNA